MLYAYFVAGNEVHSQSEIRLTDVGTNLLTRE